MSLRIIDDDFELVLNALKNPPALILDAGNKANPHRYFAYVPYDHFRQVHVVAVDAIYRFRDTLKQADRIASELCVKQIIITSFDYLFNYQDETENADVMEHVKELIAKLSKKYEVIANMKESFVPVF